MIFKVVKRNSLCTFRLTGFCMKNISFKKLSIDKAQEE